MSVVSLLGVQVKNNPAPFDAPYEFEITFECLEKLQKDLEWKLTYVGSATSSEYDQELDSLLVGPIPVGVNRFTFEADPPKLTRIPDSEIIGVTVILLSCSYDGREFVRVGYYVNNEYADEELNQNPPTKPIIEKVKRNILAEKPRVTRFAIKWDSEATAPAEYPPDQPEADLQDDDAEAYGAEEQELQAKLEASLAEAEAIGDEAAGSDAEMGGTEEAVAREDVSDAESEDLEAESDEDDEDDEEGEEEGEEGADEEMEMGEDSKGKAAAGQQGADVMVH